MVGESSSGLSSSGRVGWSQAVLAPGAVLAGYQLEQRIGAGGMAVVFRARDERLGRTVALKVVAPTLAGDDGFRERFIRESRAAAAVDHPHIIPVYGAGEAGGVLFLAMRYVSGGDLHSVMRREGPLPAERAAFLLSPVASALDAAHAAGLVHRDVKPANVLVDMSPGRPDHPYLSDFGLAKGTASGAGLTGTGQFIGTVDYAAPEQITGGRAHFQTDQYALACVAFAMLTGALPFAREAPMAVLWAHLNDSPPSVAARRRDLPGAVDQVLGQALAKDPAARYPSCGAFADALRAALGVGPYTVPAPQYPGQQYPGQRHSGPQYPGPRSAGQSGPGGMPAPGASAAPFANGSPGWVTVPGERAPVTDAPFTGGPVTGGLASGAPPASPGHRSRPPAGRRRGVLAAASAVVLAGAAVIVAVLVYPGTSTPPQVSSGSTGGGTTRQAGAPKASASATGGGGAKQGGSGAVTGPPVRFTNPGAVPNVAAGFDSDDNLISVGTNGTAYTWDMTARQVTGQVGAQRGPDFQRAAISAGGDTMAVQASGGAAYIFSDGDSDSGNLPVGERLYPGSIALSGLTIATGDAAGTGADVWTDVGFSNAPAVTLTNPDGGAALTSVALSVDAATVATSDDSGRTDVWDANNGKLGPVLKPPDGSVVNCSVFSYGSGVLNAGNGLLATGNRDGRAYLWNTATGKLIRSVQDPGGSVDTVAISFGGSTLATAGSGDAVYLWNASTGASMGTLTDPGGAGVVSLAFDDTYDELAVADKNGTTYVWTLAD